MFATKPTFAIFSGSVSKLTQATKTFHSLEDIKEQRLFLDDLAKKLNFTDQEGWYTITSKTLKQHGGDDLLEIYKSSPSKLLVAVYPEYLTN